MAKQGFDFKAWAGKLQELDVNDLNEIDWEDMGSWPTPGKVVFCSLIFVAVLVAGYFLLVKDSGERLQQEASKEVQLKKDIEKKAYRVANLDAYKEQLAEMRDSFGSLLKQLPKDTEVPGLIDDISAAALGAGLKLNAISPQKMVNTEFYNELPIRIEVDGGYHEMGAFVSGVAALPRIVTLHDFAISSAKKDGLSMTILAKTYQYGGGDE
ncbi:MULTISPECIES: type 4a pilus biogenesis protein PilO [unclassified Oceanobacter]|uniref:type 4a pilus biogenesis protein PilO n=1 Tax=unclassified Oceanobacter TaxID=2620260 RepID=UPI002735E20A|nr:MULTISPECIES: type 4a pilus biogenesis protein PilO [unclassified Oceanobacter]MDP2505613.1 type 4a pilus biogenesis protein PilO [Oceanobacter sp. 3_MG-2023]MDP2547195.1 type 4a pilus biogenesis protein PilO [Oceanobacter sp. 4_MG-2023]